MVLSIYSMENFLRNYRFYPLKMAYIVVSCCQMNNEVQAKLSELQQKGWTLANIARALGQATVTVESWKAGARSPANLHPVLASLDRLLKRKRIPKQKVYAKSSCRREVSNDT